MFFGSNTNNSDVVSTNTTIMVLYSDLSSLTIGAWNDKINLKFSPSIGKDGNGLNQYDRERRANTALSQQNACTLYEMIRKEILPKLENKEDIGTGINVAVSMGRPEAKNLLIVEYKPDENKQNRFYLTLAQNVSDTGVVTDENKISYKFNQTEIMTNYDSATGSGTMETVESEFLNFVEVLRRRIDIEPMIAHSIRHSNSIGKKYANGSSNYSNQNNNQNFGSFSNGFTSEDVPDELPFN